jgi:DNA-binding NarL/FixJ family response regulator
VQRYADTLLIARDTSGGLSEERNNQAILPFVIHGHVKRDAGDPPNDELSKSKLARREIEVVRLLAVGQSGKEISSTLKISIRTVETYRSRILLKLGLHSTNELVRFAIRTNLIRP